MIRSALVSPSWMARCLAVLVLLGGMCAASELRHGTIRYQRVEGNAVRFYIQMQWRRTDAFGGSSDHDHKAKTGDTVEVMGAAGSASGPVTFATGDGKEYRVIMTVTDYSASPADEYIYGYAKIMHAYPSESNGRRPWVAVLRGCCRQGDGTEFRLTTYVDLKESPQSLSVKSMPVIVVPEGNVTIVELPANSAGGAAGRYWRMAQGAELGGLVNPDSHRVYFNLSDYLEGRLTVDADCGATSGCSLRAGADVPVGVMVAGWYGKAFVPIEFRLKVLSHKDWIKRPLLYGPAVNARDLHGVAGYEMFITLHAMSRDSRIDEDGKVQYSCLQAIRVLNMPDGAFLSNSLASAESCVNRTLDFRWTPSAAEVGTHSVCYDAVDDTRRHSTQQCLRLLVSAPPADGLPHFTTPVANEQITFYMRNQKFLTIAAESSNPYEVMSIEASDPAMLQSFGMTMSPTSNVRGRVRATDTAPSSSVSAEFGWWPHISHGALNMSVCFKLVTYQDPGRSAVVPQERCVIVSVLRCKYVATEGDDIKKIASIFKLDWLTLWGLNANLASLETPAGKEIMVGRLYQVLEGDTILSVATQFQTSVSSIRTLNYDLSSPRAASALPPSTSICIFPNTCP